MSTVGFAKLQLAADAEAVAWFARGLEVNRNFPDLHFGYVAALALQGRLDEARLATKTDFQLRPHLRSVAFEAFQCGAMLTSLQEPSVS